MTDRASIDAELVRRIYDCFLERENWPKLLARLTREFRSTYSVFMTQDRLTGLARIMATDVVPQDRQCAYETYYAQRTPTLHHWDRLCAGEVFTDAIYDDYDGYLRSEIYNDFFRPLRADHIMCLQVSHDRTEDKSIVLRRSRRAGPFDGNNVARLHRLGRHLCNAERLSGTVRAAETVTANLGTLLDRLRIAAFVTDRTGLVRYMTPRGEHLLRDGRVLTVAAGRLDIRHAGLDSRLRKAIRDCADSVDDPRKVATCALRASRTPGSGPALAIFVSAIAWGDTASNARAAALVVVNEPDELCGRAAMPTGALAELFDLTPAQSRVALALCAGRSLSEHAALEGISVHTARTQLKRVQEKTETHSQAELVSLLLRSSTLVTSR